MKRTSCVVVALGSVVGMASPADAMVDRPGPSDLTWNSELILFGVVDSVEGSAPDHSRPPIDIIELLGGVNSVARFAGHPDIQCAWIRVREVLRGGPLPWSVQVCCPAPESRRMEYGRGPRINVGEDAIIFGSRLLGQEVVLADPYLGLIQSSDYARTMWDVWGSYEDLRESVAVGVRLAGSPAQEQARIALALVGSESGFAWGLLGLLVRERGEAGGGPNGTGFDPGVLVPALVGCMQRTDHRPRRWALDLLGTINESPGVRSRYLNELMDVALVLLEDPDYEVRRTAHSIAQHRTTIQVVYDDRPNHPMGYGIVQLGADFGYRPDAPPAERERALADWRRWWAENRGRGAYDKSEERIAKQMALEADVPRIRAETNRASAEQLKLAIEIGRFVLDPKDPGTPIRIQALREIGYDVTPDGRIVPVDVCMPEESGDAGGDDSEAVGAGEDVAPSGPGAAANSSRRACGCSAPMSGGGNAVAFAGLAALLGIAVLRGRRR